MCSIFISDEESIAQQNEYKKNYPPFRPFRVSSKNKEKIALRFENLVSTQNGQDTDDYALIENNKVKKYLDYLEKGARVLLLGVGTGREVLAAKYLGFNAVGTTLGSRNIDFGIKYLDLSEEELIECLNEVLPFPRETFDVVAGFQVFEHTMAPLLFLLEQSRVLKIGGKLLLEWPPADKFHMDDNPHHQVCFTPGQAKALFQKAGFSDIKLYYDDFTPIAEEDFWRGDQDKMLVIEGKKVHCGKDYVRRSWEL